jgi:hypothetical protein
MAVDVHTPARADQAHGTTPGIPRRIAPGVAARHAGAVVSALEAVLVERQALVLRLEAIARAAGAGGAGVSGDEAALWVGLARLDAEHHALLALLATHLAPEDAGTAQGQARRASGSAAA